MMTRVGLDDDLEAAVDAAPAGAVLVLEAGVWAVRLVLRRPVTLRAEAPGARLEGIAGRPIARIELERGAVTFEGVTFADGDAELGGALMIGGGAEVVARACRFEGNRATKGGAIYVGGGELRCEGCHFEDNAAREGGAIHVDGVAQVRLAGCVVTGNSSARGAGVSVHDGATVVIDDTRFTDQGGDEVDLRVRGTTSRAPKVSVTGKSGPGTIDAHPADAVTRG